MENDHQTFSHNIEQYHDSARLDARIFLHRRFSTNPQGWYAWVFDTLEKLPAQAQVLELGCGPGYLWSNSTGRIPEKWSITLADISEGMLLAAWRNLVVTGRAFKYEKMDACSIPFPNQSFDIVIANHVLYHVADLSAALHEIRRVLTPGGTLVASTVGNEHMREMNGWIQQACISPFTPFHESFTLENGLPLLTSLFTHVSRHIYADNLQITEVEPIISYIRSCTRPSEISEAKLEELKISLQRQMQEQKSLFVTKHTGLFLAVA